MRLERLRNKARKDICGLTEIFKAFVDNRFEYQNILRRIMRDLKGVKQLTRTYASMRVIYVQQL